jgi:hypothetical protein
MDDAGLPPKTHNNPPPDAAISSARIMWTDLSKWLETTPVIVDDKAAAEAKTFLDRAKATLADLNQAKEIESKPLFEAHRAAVAKYKKPYDLIDALRTQLGSRIKAWLDKLEAERLAALAKARAERDEAERIAREKEAAEKEAIENAAVGECTDVAGATAQADAAFDAFKKADRAETRADKAASNVRLGGGFSRSVSVRKVAVPLIDDLEAAIKVLQAVGLTDKVREALISSARDWKKLKGDWPAGIRETIDERV